MSGTLWEYLASGLDPISINSVLVSVHPEPKNDTEAGLIWETPSKKGGKKKKSESDGGRERERRALSSPSRFSLRSLPRAAPYYLKAWNRLGWENSRHFGTPPRVSREMMSDKRVQKFHFDDATVPRGSASDWLKIFFNQSEALPRYG